LWVEKGWRRTHNGYQGHFEALGRRWRGEILVPYPGGYEAYIWEPPLQELSDHPHRPCFFARGADRYNVHFRAMPTSVDHAITNIETILREAIQRSQGYANRRVA